MLRLLLGLACAAVMVVPAHADIPKLSDSCSIQPSGTQEVDGANATEGQMKAARQDVQTFVDAAQEYITCVSLYIESTKKLPPPDRQRLVGVIAQVADEKEAVGCAFQKELDVYNRKHGLDAVEFDPVCVDRFAREGTTTPASKTP